MTPDSTRRLRAFNNLYGIWQLSPKWGLTLGFDLGTQQESKNSETWNNWYGLVGMLRYTLSPRWSSTLRYEYYHDPEQVIVSTNSANGYRTSGISLNFDHEILDLILVRMEGRWFLGKDDIYPRDGAFTDQNFFLLAAVQVELSTSR